ncbi:hypothetical protein [Poseidonibacter ostreae]|uniref:Uncharacterized protein n=1 Tax=Poseidonibacter ostreae TaxID=2654171 RepID=A0A6L4WWU2_9BACT|nr:hypothetical protein [Poseidonibacter ostreae]KAB7891408.1 hypothetical protein GBG19_00800 [Poseidonibacter ostreae]
MSNGNGINHLLNTERVISQVLEFLDSDIPSKDIREYLQDEFNQFENKKVLSLDNLESEIIVNSLINELTRIDNSTKKLILDTEIDKHDLNIQLKALKFERGELVNLMNSKYDLGIM